jgi:hypothetical protein
MKDWRTDYLICEHIAEDESLEAFHNVSRVCCRRCADAGFLFEELDTVSQGEFAVGKLKHKE